MWEIGEVEVRIDTEREHVHRDGDDVDVARALPVAEECALDTVCTREQPHLRICYAAAAVVVRVEGKDDAVTVFQPLIDVGNLHSVDV